MPRRSTVFFEEKPGPKVQLFLLWIARWASPTQKIPLPYFSAKCVTACHLPIALTWRCWKVRKTATGCPCYPDILWFTNPAIPAYGRPITNVYNFCTLSGHPSGLCRDVYSSAQRNTVQQSHLRGHRRHAVHELPEEAPGRNQVVHSVMRLPILGRTRSITSSFRM